ncbi:MAG: hypothetical protein A2W31_05115 [Planctomycetes bacterium RBG_16_64_10]|nr:MAG: hypothetical protein A2W31_05115 [Planctomycetes bacterium RBG_16_64_10]
MDLALAKTYLDCLAHDGGGWTFQTFDDSEEKRLALAKVVNVARGETVSRLLADLNDRGAGIFVTVNRTDGKGRTAENVVALRALFVDADDVPMPKEWHETPDMLVTRSQTRWHAYWRVRADTPLVEFTTAQKRLAAHYGTDPKVFDLPRVMRVPGFLHRKGDPTALELQCTGSDVVRTTAEVLQGVAELPAEPERKAPVPASSANGDERLFAAWAAKKAADVVEGDRNNKLFEMACEGAGRGLSESVVFGVCLQYANGLKEPEVRGVVRSAYSKDRKGNPPQRSVQATAKWKPKAAPAPQGELDRLLDDAMSGRRYVVALPWPQIGAATRALLPGTVTILAGPPGSTKSFAIVQCLRFWTDAKVSAGLMALEYGVGPHARRVLAQIVGDGSVDDDEWCLRNPDKVREYRKRASPLIDEVESRISALPRGVPKTPEHFLAWMEAKAATHRVLCFDPITMMEKQRESWLSDQKFLDRAKDIIEAHGCSLILVSHPRKMQQNQTPQMDDLAGGVVYSRFSQTILYLHWHKPKEVKVSCSMGVTTAMANRTISIFKANNGRGIEGAKFAMHFDGKSLTLSERGKIAD